MTRIHLSQNIAGLLRNSTDEQLADMLTDNDGDSRPGVYWRYALEKMLKQGIRCFPLCDPADCPDFDEKGGGCPGHPMEEKP